MDIREAIISRLSPDIALYHVLSYLDPSLTRSKFFEEMKTTEKGYLKVAHDLGFAAYPAVQIFSHHQLGEWVGKIPLMILDFDHTDIAHIITGIRDKPRGVQLFSPVYGDLECQMCSPAGSVYTWKPQAYGVYVISDKIPYRF